jgi:general secretion pathway protein N
MRRRWWRELLFLSALLLSLVAFLPLRLALESLGFAATGLAARQVEGSVWLGALADARFGAVELGDVATRLRLLPLLAGRARLDLVQKGEGEGFRGGSSLSRHGFGIDDASGDLPVPKLAGLAAPALRLDDLSVHFADGLCADAEGPVEARLAGGLGGVPLAAGFSGEARCDGPALLLPLASQAGGERLDLRLFADGRYRIDAALRPGGLPRSARLEGRF